MSAAAATQRTGQVGLPAALPGGLDRSWVTRPRDAAGRLRLAWSRDGGGFLLTGEGVAHGVA
ncbi:hypothetical protein [Pseudonocardia acaciae]|uniref:hypothetical protein n=1 Tax=Pseudonocardia acaciae TaxID=551276 RepID=UPI00048D03C1|nr:hypothetical protein [Pseudonocardia acaciae]